MWGMKNNARENTRPRLMVISRQLGNAQDRRVGMTSSVSKFFTKLAIISEKQIVSPSLQQSKAVPVMLFSIFSAPLITVAVKCLQL